MRRPPQTLTIARGQSLAQYLALAAVVFTWPLLLVGGAVSVYRLGMAVPDWPTTFGLNMFYYNMFEAPRGVFAEHSHRLYASLVGMACIGLASYFSLVRLGRNGLWLVVVAVAVAVAAALSPAGSIWGVSRVVVALAALGGLSSLVTLWAFLVRRDDWLGLAWLALTAVVIQGSLGGSRVTLNSPTFAFVHGVFGQFVFATLVTLWVTTTRRWLNADSTITDDWKLRRISRFTLVLIAGQIAAGAYVRHFGSPAAVAVHGLLALAVIAHVFMLALRVGLSGAVGKQTGLTGPVTWMAAWVLVQIGLGVACTLLLWPFDGVPRPVDGVQALGRIGHQGAGALLLASATVLTLRVHRGLAAAQSPSSAAWPAGVTLPGVAS